MSLTLPNLVVALPFGTAVVLACVPSWRAGVWINAVVSSLVFVLACLLPWRSSGTLSTHLALLTAFVAMTASWLGWRDIRAALAARRLNRRSAQVRVAACGEIAARAAGSQECSGTSPAMPP